MTSLSKEELLNLLKQTYVLLTEDYKPYGIQEIRDLTFFLSSDFGEPIICCVDGARLENRTLSVINTEGKEIKFNLLLSTQNENETQSC